jgi:transglutaminase-like putative cysteine protease
MYATRARAASSSAVGYELIYDCPHQTPMVLMLNIHHTRANDIVVPDRMMTVPSIPVTSYRDGFGNWCTRILAPTGRLQLTATALVRDTGRPDAVALCEHQHAVEDLPEEALVFLLGSRYCETDRLADIAWNLFGQSPTGARRVQAICDYVHHHITFNYQDAR